MARRDLHRGVGLTADDFELRQVPSALLPIAMDPRSGQMRAKHVFHALDRVVGQVPYERVLAGEIVRPERLANTEAGIGLNAVLPRGLVAFTLGVSDDAPVPSDVRPAVYVDIASSPIDPADGVQTILRRAFVLAVKPAGVTMLLRPRQAEQLALAEALGGLSFAVSAPDETDPVDADRSQRRQRGQRGSGDHAITEDGLQ